MDREFLWNYFESLVLNIQQLYSENNKVDIFFQQKMHQNPFMNYNHAIVDYPKKKSSLNSVLHL